MRTLIATNGGDTCALNASLASIRDSALAYGPTTIVFGAIGGYRGLIEGRVIDITNRNIYPFHGGSILKSLRDSPCRRNPDGTYEVDEEKAAKIVHSLKKFKIDVLVVIGGDGTLRATKLFFRQVVQRHNFRIIGFLKTIDNDVRTYSVFQGIETALCPGFPTAARRIFEIVKRIRTTAETCERIFTVETMGRDAGWLAAATAVGGADQVVIPETAITAELLQRLSTQVQRSYAVARNAVVGVSEGVSDQMDKGAIKMIYDTEKPVKFPPLGPRKSYGAGVEIAGALTSIFKRDPKLKNVEIRCHETGYEPRAGSPTTYDVKLSGILGWRVGRLIRDRANGVVPTLREVVGYDDLDDSLVQDKDITEIDKIYLPTQEFYSVDDLNVTDRCVMFLKTITDCPDPSEAAVAEDLKKWYKR